MKYNVSKGHAYSTHLTTWRRLPTCSQNVAIHIGSDYIMRRTILLCFEKIPSLLSNQSQKMSKCDKITTHWGRMNKVKKHEKQKSLTNLYQCEGTEISLLLTNYPFWSLEQTRLFLHSLEQSFYKLSIVNFLFPYGSSHVELPTALVTWGSNWRTNGWGVLLAKTFFNTAAH